MHQRQTSHFRSGAALASILAFVAILALAPRAGHAQGQCPTQFRDQTSGTVADGGTICANAVGNKCTFNLELCINQPAAGCTPQDLKKRKIRAASPTLCAGGIGKVNVKANTTSSVCGGFTGVVTVKAKKHGTVARSCKIRGKAKQAKTSITLLCQPSSSPCSTTTTSTTTTTTIPPPVCGNGVVESGEVCDPPCGQGQCGAGELCDSSCHCVTAAACACGASTPTKLDFTTDVGTGNCGSVTAAGGATVLSLACGGLYFGGGLESVPLPATVPDMGSSLTKVCCSATDLTLANLTSTDTGSNRTCTSADCLFGPPLPIPNTASAATSTCIINVIAANAVGSAQCVTGASSLNLPLTSETFLFGDLLNGSTPDRPAVPGIQPCPLCRNACKVCSGGTSDGTACTSNADCSGGFCGGLPCTTDTDCPTGISCSTTPQCLGGPNDGVACTPGSGSLGDAYPTSHDCPLPPGPPIGTLPIAFALTTGTASKPGIASGTQQRVFCGYCRDAANTGCFEGDPNAAMDACPLPAGALHLCTSDADCTTPNYASCEQRDQAAFHQGTATNISEMGVPAGDMTDGAAHASTLVSVFCIPPTFNALIDNAADLPGPGAVSLPGHAQLVP